MIGELAALDDLERLLEQLSRMRGIAAAQHDEAEVVERRDLDRVIRREPIDQRARALEGFGGLALLPEEVVHHADIEREQRDVRVALAERLRIRGGSLLELAERARELSALRVDPGQVRREPAPDRGIVVAARDRLAARAPLAV